MEIASAAFINKTKRKVSDLPVACRLTVVVVVVVADRQVQCVPEATCSLCATARAIASSLAVLTATPCTSRP